MNSSEPAVLDVEFAFDFVCPWCLIGLRQLQQAEREWSRDTSRPALRMQWRATQLLPDTPLEGFNYKEFYEARLGGPGAVALRRAQVQGAAAQVGLRLAFERIETLPNTALAHAMTVQALLMGNPRQRQRWIERVFEAYFLEGQDIGRRPVLDALWKEVGLPPQTAELPRAVVLHAISAVPRFVFNDRVTLSGAQPAAALLQAMDEAQLRG